MNSPAPLSRQSTIESTYAKSPDLLMIAWALWAGKWQIAGIIAVAMGLAAVHIATTEPKYAARTILSLEGSAQKLMNFDRSGDNPVADEKKLETEAEVLRSRGLVEKLVQQLSLVNDPEFNPNLLPPEFPSVGWVLDRLRQLAGLGAAPQRTRRCRFALHTRRCHRAAQTAFFWV